jgi:hypothetical protein
MLDLSYIPNSQQDIQIFYSNGINNAWQTWNKPRKCNYVWIMCVGGAGGGAGGATTTGVGGAAAATGGASGGISRALYNAQQLPDRLYVQVGLGGAGGNPNSNGSVGTRSWVALQQAATVITPQNLVAGSGTSAGSGGGLTNGGAVSGELAITQATITFFTLANFIGTAGLGNSAQVLVQPANITPFSSQVATPGGQGGGVQNSTFALIGSGSSISSSSISPLIQGGTTSTSSGISGGDGANGITSWKPFFSTGGAGGGAASSGSGGNGGNGGIGSGGGAGGAGNSTLGYTGGRGGKGGDGLVIIISF